MCNLRDDGAERELPGPISIQPQLRSTAEEAAIALPLLIEMRCKLFETQRCVISERRFTFPGELEKLFPKKGGESGLGV